MNETEPVIINTDGASRGNPGPAAYGYVIERAGSEDIEGSGCIEPTTNNIAEYTAVIKALQHAKALGARSVAVYSDSELMVKQLEGVYRVKNEGIKPLYSEIVALRDEFDSVTFEHVPRNQNARADALCNAALDGAGNAKKTASKNKKKKLPDARKQDVRERAIECLTEVAYAWSQGNPNDPEPEQVWEQLWSILDESGVLKAS